MLRSLQIRNLAIIESLDLEFNEGFTTLTGETGAGKSILIDALGLVIGARADSTLVRGGCDKAEVSAEFEIGSDSAAAGWLAERELEDEGACLVRRVVQSDGRTRAWVNGRPLPATELRGLGETLVEIFGQNESQTLLRPDVQRTLLDEAGDHPALLDAVAAAARSVQQIDQRIEALRGAQQRDPAHVDFLRFQLQEFEALALGADELDTLDAEHRQLANAGQLIERGGNVQQLLYGGDASVYDQLSGALAALEELAPLHADYAEAAQLVAGAQAQAQEAADRLRRALDRLELDPERLAEVENRMQAIHTLARKHRVRADELLTRQVEMQQELAALEDAAGAIERLQVERAEQLQRYKTAAAQLTAARIAAASQLAEAVSARVRELGMPNARFLIAVEPAMREQPSTQGDDVVRFDFSANPGQPPRPLAKVASGGELSRVSLALQVSLRQHGGADTMIFDEVDAGIGGSVASVVGRQLHALGAARQVLSVTHLAQVAAFGDAQFRIAKQTRDGQTYTGVTLLAIKERVAELARMLGGEQITPATTALAQDLLKQAAR